MRRSLAMPTEGGRARLAGAAADAFGYNSPVAAPARADLNLGRELAQPRRLGAGVALVALLAACAWQLPETFRQLRLDIGTARHWSEAERQAAPARYLGVPQDVLPRARALIPAAATFEVITGPDVDADAPLALAGIRSLAASTLLPRRLTGDPATADWVLSYGGDLTGVGLRFRRQVTLAPGVVLAEVAR
jgi:hypothetical protein